MTKAIVHIIDDDSMARASLSFLLSTYDVPTRIYESAAEFFEVAEDARGCILLDLRMPEMDGLEFQKELARRGQFLPIVMISAEGDLSSAVKAIKYGALDFIEKGGCEVELLTAVRHALHESQTEEDQRLRRSVLANRLAGLSQRERQVLEGLCEGLANKEIGRRLQLSPRTVEMHRAKMAAKLKVLSVAEMIRMTIEAEPSAVRKKDFLITSLDAPI